MIKCINIIVSLSTCNLAKIKTSICDKSLITWVHFLLKNIYVKTMKYKNKKISINQKFKFFILTKINWIISFHDKFPWYNNHGCLKWGWEYWIPDFHFRLCTCGCFWSLMVFRICNYCEFQFCYTFFSQNKTTTF